MHTRLKLISQILLICLITPLHAAIDFDKVRLETEHVAGNISMIRMVGAHASNVGVVVGDREILVVDSQYPEMTAGLLAEIGKISNKPVRYLVNTHYHGDHTSGNINFSALGISIIAHERVRAVMSAPRVSLVTGKMTPAPPPGSVPTVTYSGSMEVDLGNETVRIFHVPKSHTSGDSFIHFGDSNVLQMGDTFRTTTYPIADPSDGGNYQGLIKVMEMAIEISNQQTRIIPGHGHVSNVDELRQLKEMMLTIQERVRRAVEQGESLEQLLASRPTAKFDERWGFPGGHFMTVERMLSLIYGELKAR